MEFRYKDEINKIEIKREETSISISSKKKDVTHLIGERETNDDDQK